ncbi:MAG: alpha/beta fold hydrolase [Dehalococcoidales bacterium]|nr:alpha/beta fold hydrolase [Dehalococcoidales bacterium]
MSSKKKKIIKITAITLGVLIVLYLGLSIYGAWQGTVLPRLPLAYTGGSLSLSYEDVSFCSRGDNVLLNGWFLPAEKDEVVIIVHGGFQNRIDENADTLDITRILVQTGYNVLLFDLRGRGESEGQGLALSYIDEDIGGAVDFLRSRGYGTEDICIMGFCSGAASACIYASRNDVGALILVGCFVDVQTMVIRQAQSVGIPQFLAQMFYPGTLFFARIIYGFEVIHPIDVVGNVRCKILFIHEEFDEFTTFEETYRLFEASVNPANRIWEVLSTNHSQVYITHPLEFIERVDDFLSQDST